MAVVVGLVAALQQRPSRPCESAVGFIFRSFLSVFGRRDGDGRMTTMHHHCGAQWAKLGRLLKGMKIVNIHFSIDYGDDNRRGIQRNIIFNFLLFP